MLSKLKKNLHPSSYALNSIFENSSAFIFFTKRLLINNPKLAPIL